MLDFKALSVRQVFRTFQRTEAYLQSNFKLSDLTDPTFSLPSNARQHILEDLADLYLGYLYDKNLRHQVLTELVHSIWNRASTSSQAILDPQAVSDYVIDQTR